ncbi:hypothetical protein U1Q18_051301, partial [Sarracenia purpurea var. burkii]
KLTRRQAQTPRGHITRRQYKFIKSRRWIAGSGTNSTQGGGSQGGGTNSTQGGGSSGSGGDSSTGGSSGDDPSNHIVPASSAGEQNLAEAFQNFTNAATSEESEQAEQRIVQIILQLLSAAAKGTASG